MPYPFVGNLSLDVENPSLNPPGTATNQVPNPNGEGGGWGWVTEVGLVRDARAFHGEVPTLGYRAEGSAGGPASLVTEPQPVTPGTRYVAAYSTVALASTWHRGTLTFHNAADAVLATHQSTITVAGAQANIGISSAITVPAGAVTVRLRIHLYGSVGGGNPPNDAWLYMRNVRMAPVDALAKIVAAQYTNVLNASTTITVEREPLNVGTLSATIVGSAFDPAVHTLLRPGRRLRLHAFTLPVYTGKVASAAVTYDADEPVERRAQITLTAVDAASDLANAPRPEGYSQVIHLREVVEGAGVPWDINGSTAQGLRSASVTRNESATALDQIAITRDSRRGYAWVSRKGVLFAVDNPTFMPGLKATLTETEYLPDLDVSWDVDQVINTVRITHRRVNAATGETVEVPYGPYIDPASVREWGPREATFVVHGLTDNEATMKAYADAVLAASSQPQIRVNTLSIEVRNVDDAIEGRALLDLYDKVRVTNANIGLDQTVRVTSIRHTITPDSWLVTLGFGRDGGTAPPQATPALASTPAAVAAEGYTPLTLAGSVTGVIDYRVGPDGYVHVEGTMTFPSLAAGATLALVAVGGIPAAHRPPRSLNLHIARLSNNASGMVQRLADGSISVVNASSSAVTSAQFAYGYYVS